MFVRWAMVFIGLVAVVRSKAEDCTPEEWEQCRHPLENADVDEYDGLFPDKEFLDTYCSPFLGFLKCRIDFNDKCPDSDVDPIAKMIRSGFNLATSMCDDDSPLKKGYLDNVECYANNTAGILLCGQTATVILERFEGQMKNRTDVPQGEEMVGCVGIPFVVNCGLGVVSENCGEKETEPLDHILNRYSDILVGSMCPEDKISIWEEEFALFLGMEEKKRRK